MTRIGVAMETVVLSVDQIQCFAALKSCKERRGLLASYSDLVHLDEDEDLRSACLLDFIYENVNFAVSSGFSWKECVAFNTLMQDLLKETVVLDSLLAAVNHIKAKLRLLSSSFSSRTLIQTTNYIFTSYLTHFRLFQHVFTQSRDLNHTVRRLTVNRPTSLPSMREGMEQSIWEKEENRKSIDIKREEKLNAVEAKRTEEREEIEALRHKSFDKLDKGVPDVSSLVNDAVHDQTTATFRVVHGEIEDHKSRVEIHMKTLALKSPVFAPALESQLTGNSPSPASASPMSTKGGKTPNVSKTNKKSKSKKKS